MLFGTGFGGSLRHTVKLGSGVFKARELPAVKTEMARIFKNNNSTTGILSGEVLLDAQFTRSAMISTLQKRRPLVHIASHFIFKPGDEANSFLLLGDGAAFTLDEMKRQKDLFAGVELLALSACDTAAQQEDSNGREVDGFAELAQRLGAGAVMASLWEVQDESTAELMTRFYKTYNSQKGANKATALRSAQLALLSGEYKTAGAANRGMIREDAETAAKIKIESAKLKPFNYAKNPRFAHPYYWSPFILIGNWK
jgi:CHAT domain-containing protein